MGESPAIQVLDPSLANQIAAGEVVENPASVVKELVENSLDAGALRVTLTVDGAGIERIQVVDDGAGMSSEDAILALERHATSKIRVPDDLTHIATLGFRGEALPSISSVSRLEIRTKRKGAVAGTRVTSVPGEPLVKKRDGCPEGTSVEVRDLFFNTPARLKFLKSKSAETARITEVVARLALSRPGVAFILRRGSRVTRSYLARKELAERVQEVLGSDLPLRRADGEVGPVGVTAWVTGPERSRVGARSLHLIVNGRLVRDPGLLRAVWAAFDGTLDHGHYPLGVVDIALDPRLVDVNVHPQKAEVRFVDRGAVYGAVHRIVGSVVRVGMWPASSSHAAPGAAAEEVASYHPGEPGVPSSFQPIAGWNPKSLGSSPGGFSATSATSATSARGVPYASLRYLGSAGRAWLVCEGPDGLVIIDQHAAHERITFERLRGAFQKGEVPAQRLLVPEHVEVSAAELTELGERGEELHRIGFEVEPFSTTAVTITAVPAALADGDPRRLLDEVLGEIGGLRAPLADSVDQLLARLACHASVRAGKRLKPEEVASLLEGLDETDLGGHCPHGRPVAVDLSWIQLERRLGRR